MAAPRPPYPENDPRYWFKDIPCPLFRRYPRLRAFLLWSFAGSLGYFVLIALLSWLKSPWLAGWIGLWSPLVDAMREIMPSFDKIERTLVMRGFGHRVPVVHHLLMAGWLFLVPAQLVATAAIFSLRREEWLPIASRSSRWILLFYFVVSAPMVPAAWFVLVAAFSEPPDLLGMGAFDRFNLALVSIWLIFLMTFIFTCMAHLCLTFWIGLRRGRGAM